MKSVKKIFKGKTVKKVATAAKKKMVEYMAKPVVAVSTSRG